MTLNKPGDKGVARMAFFSKRDAVFAAIEKGELPKQIWRREFGGDPTPSISYVQFTRLLKTFLPDEVRVLMARAAPVGRKRAAAPAPSSGDDVSVIQKEPQHVQRPAAGETVTPDPPQPQPQRPPTYGRINPNPYKFGDLKIDLNEVYGLPPEKKPDR